MLPLLKNNFLSSNSTVTDGEVDDLTFYPASDSKSVAENTDPLELAAQAEQPLQQRETDRISPAIGGGEYESISRIFQEQVNQWL